MWTWHCDPAAFVGTYNRVRQLIACGGTVLPVLKNSTVHVQYQDTIIELMQRKDPELLDIKTSTMMLFMYPEEAAGHGSACAKRYIALCKQFFGCRAEDGFATPLLIAAATAPLWSCRAKVGIFNTEAFERLVRKAQRASKQC